MKNSNIRQIISDSEIRIIKQQTFDKLTEIFKDSESLEDKQNAFWHHIVEAGWSSEKMSEIIKREEKLNGGTTYDLLLQVEGQYTEEVMREMGYEVSDGFC